MQLEVFLWGYVKDILYKTPVTSLDELKRRIVNIVFRLPVALWTEV
jgi:hypothetical protein